jgi:hypothetical protein
MREPADVEALTRYISDEIYTSLGLPAWRGVRKLLDPIVNLPANRFSQVAARMDQYVAQFGLREAARRTLPAFASGFHQTGAENIPTEGPLLIASNHPGTCDGLVVTANIPRPDLKIIATGIPFTQGLPNIAEHVIYVPREGPGRANVIRQSIRHLKSGGALLIFPSGRVDPDPAIASNPEVTFERWNAGLELILNHVPHAQVLFAMVSGVLSSNWLHHPLTWLTKEAWKKNRTAELLQIIDQMIHPNRVDIHPTVTFGQALQVEELTSADHSLLDGIIQQARQLLQDHVVSILGHDTAQV